jgi:hypothetical protein
MKIPQISVVCLALLAGVFLSPLHAAPSAVRVRVEAVNKSETEKDKKTQKRSLKVFVSNSSKEALELKVKYVIFGRQLAERKEFVTVDEGQLPASVAPMETKQVDTLPATSTSVEEHYEKTKKVEASGNKIVGYGVQILQGETVVAEAYDPPSMKEQFGKTVKVTPSAKK